MKQTLIHLLPEKRGFYFPNKVFPFLILITLILSSCKPTEQGYKAAYDAALNKRELAKDYTDVNLPEGAIIQTDGPILREIDGENVYVQNIRIKPYSEYSVLPGTYNVAIGVYKMNTNCAAQVKNLREEGFDAFVAKDTEDRYYYIVGSFDSVKEAIELSNKYQKKKNRVYIGLPDAPVIIYSPK